MSLGASKADLELKLDDCIMRALDSLLKNSPASDEFMAIFQAVRKFANCFCFISCLISL